MSFLYRLIGGSSVYVYLIIVGFCFLLYGRSVAYDYALDDHLITGSVAQKGFRGIVKAFKSKYYKHQQKSEESSGYRPVTIASFALEYGLFGQKPAVSHFINILLYALGCILLFHVLARLFENSSDLLLSGIMRPQPPPAADVNISLARLLAFLTTLLFVVHPIHSEVVCNIKSRDELLAFLFVLAAFNALITWSSGHKKWHILYVLLFLFAALLSKKTILPFILILPLSVALFRAARWQYMYLLAVPLLLVFYVQIKKIGTHAEASAGRSYTYIENPLYFSGFSTRLPAGIYIMGEYSRKLLWPSPLLYYYGYNNIPISGWGNIWVWVSLLFHTTLLVIAVKQYRSRPILSFGLLCYLGLLFVFSNILRPGPGIIADRFVYGASFAFCLLAAYGLLLLSFYNKAQTTPPKPAASPTVLPSPKQGNKTTVKTPKQSPPPTEAAGSPTPMFNLVGIALFAVFMFGFAAFTWARVPAWKNLNTLLGTDMPQLHNSAKANMLYADLLAKKIVQGDTTSLSKMEKHYLQALAIYPDYIAALNNLGFLYMKTNRIEEAQKVLGKAAAIDSTSMQTFYNLGHCAKQLKQKDEAIRLFVKVSETDKKELGKAAFGELYNIYYADNDSTALVQMLEKAVIAFPNVAAFREELDKRKH